MHFLYITTISSTVNNFLLPHIEMLIRKGHRVDIACKITTEIPPLFSAADCVITDVPFVRTPFAFQNIKAWRIIRERIATEKYDVIHCHTPVASFITRIACMSYRKKGMIVIYTAHGFHFFTGAPMRNWLLYYPVERFLARFTDIIITINKEDFRRARAFKTQRLEYVHGVGIDTLKFERPCVEPHDMRTRLGIPEDAFVVLSVGELNYNKNHQLIVHAIGKLKNMRIVYVIAGRGKNADDLTRLACEYGIEDKMFLLGYRTDMCELYHMADMLASASKREGLPASIMEAMAAGLPVVCSDIRGHRDLVASEKGGFMCKTENAEAFSTAIQYLVEHPDRRRAMGAYNRETVQKYALSSVLTRMQGIYETLENGGSQPK